MAHKDCHEEQPSAKRIKKEQTSPSVKAEVDETWITVMPPQAVKIEEENEIDELFNYKKKTNETSPAETAMDVELIMAQLEIAAEDDAELNRQGKPALNKLMKIDLLTEALSKEQLQQLFLDHGILTLLRTWLGPLPDGSFPNINIREAILRILKDYQLDLEQSDRSQQLKQSGLGKVVMYLSKSDVDATCRRLATEVVDKWSRPLFEKSSRFGDMRKVVEVKRVPLRRPAVSRGEIKEGDLDEFSRKRSCSGQAVNSRAEMPEVSLTPYKVHPQSKIIDLPKIRASSIEQQLIDQRRLRQHIRIIKKLQHLKRQNKKQRPVFKLLNPTILDNSLYPASKELDTK